MRTPATAEAMTGAQSIAGASPVTPARQNDNTGPHAITIPVHTCQSAFCEECRTAPLWRYYDAEGAELEDLP